MDCFLFLRFSSLSELQRNLNMASFYLELLGSEDLFRGKRAPGRKTTSVISTAPRAAARSDSSLESLKLVLAHDGLKNPMS